MDIPEQPWANQFTGHPVDTKIVDAQVFYIKYSSTVGLSYLWVPYLVVFIHGYKELTVLIKYAYYKYKEKIATEYKISKAIRKKKGVKKKCFINLIKGKKF